MRNERIVMDIGCIECEAESGIEVFLIASMRHKDWQMNAMQNLAFETQNNMIFSAFNYQKLI